MLHATPAECAPVQDTCAVRAAAAGRAGAGAELGASKERAWLRFAHESSKLIYGPFVSLCRHAADPTYYPTLGAYYPYDNDKKFLCSHTCRTQTPTHIHTHTGMAESAVYNINNNGTFTLMFTNTYTLYQRIAGHLRAILAPKIFLVHSHCVGVACQWRKRNIVDSVSRRTENEGGACCPTMNPPQGRQSESVLKDELLRSCRERDG